MRDVAFTPSHQQPDLPEHDQGQTQLLLRRKLLHQAQEAHEPARHNPLTGNNLLNGQVNRGRSEASRETQVTGTSVFDDLAGVKPKSVKQKELKQRLKTTVNQRRQQTQRRQTTRIQVNLEDDDEPIKEAATRTVVNLRERGRESLEQDLEQEFDPLQRFALLDNALREVDRQDLSVTEKEELKDQLDGMLKDLMTKHRSEIRRGMKSAEDIEAAVQAMTPGANTASLRELRFMYGAKGTGVFDSPLSPLAMAKALQQRFGADNFTSGLNSLRSKMSGEMRAEHKKSQTPRFWLCMSDANAFTAVQSTFAISTELRRELVEKANVLPKATPASMTVSLLSIVDAGKSKVGSLVSQIYDVNKDNDPVRKAQVYTQVSLAIRRLPTSLWPNDKMGQRLDLIDELSKQVVGSYKGMPMPELAVERKEREWRAELESKKPGAAPAA